MSDATTVRRARFAAEVAAMVRASAPRIFAVVQEYGDCEDGRIAAWGMAFDDCAEIISAGGMTLASLATPESALRLFRYGEHIASSLCWADQDHPTSGAFGPATVR